MAGIDRPGSKVGDRDKALETALAQIERQFGRGSIMRLGDEARAPIEVIPTGAISLDVALGIGGLPRGRVVEIFGPEGSGKALALDTPIPTPKGWTTMGELSPGQEVFASDGSTTQVTFATPVMTGHECFRVRFSDGSEIIADADHQWVTENDEERRGRSAQRWGVRTTQQIAATLRAGRQANHAVRTTQPFVLPDTELPLDPYVFGLWLGDGGSRGDTFTTADPELLEAFHWAAFPTTAKSKQYEYYVKGLKDALRPLGVLRNKHIPVQYLRGSEEQRRALLAGLLDTDGSIRHSAGLIRFVNTNEALIDGVRELVHSLGLTTRVSVREAGTYGPNQRRCWTVVFTPDSDAGEFFRLRRKRGHRQLTDRGRARRRYITAVEPVVSVPVRCIQVDHPSHTYLAGRECIPTHNTTVALHAVASAQKNGGIAAFIDAEHALDPDYAKNLGVDTDALLVSQPDTGEQALEIADMLIRSSAIDVIVIDSVAALVPRAEIEGEMGDSHVGLQARLMSQAMRKLAGALNQTKTTAIFINQLREKVGVLFGSPETTSGGRALKFYASVRLDVRRIETLKDGTEAVGSRTKVKVVKNKVAPPFRSAEFDIVFGQGISREGGLIDLGVEQSIVRKSGAWYTYEGDQLGQGKENARTFLRDNPDLANEIEKKIKEKLGIGARLDAEAAEGEPSAGPGLRAVPSVAPTAAGAPTAKQGGTPGGQG
jgi:recombination protein RecA